MLGVVRPGLRAYAGRRGPQLGSSSDDLALVLLVMLASALATEALGVHALFGAFFAGLMLPRAAQIEPMLSARVEPLVMTLLLPLFFAVAGLRTNVQLIDSTAMWLDAAAIVAVAVVAKGGASALAARVMGLEWRDAAALGALLNARGLVELVILNIGLEIGILSPLAYSIMVMMALITTFMTSPLLTLLWQGDAAGAGGRSGGHRPCARRRGSESTVASASTPLRQDQLVGLRRIGRRGRAGIPSRDRLLLRPVQRLEWTPDLVDPIVEEIADQQIGQRPSQVGMLAHQVAEAEAVVVLADQPPHAIHALVEYRLPTGQAAPPDVSPFASPSQIASAAISPERSASSTPDE